MRSTTIHTYYVYILASPAGTLSIGMTNDLERRVYEYKHRLIPGFSSGYNADRLVHIEDFSDVYEAMDRKRQLKSWRRGKKVDLVERENPGWNDYSSGWFPTSGGHAAGLHRCSKESIADPSALPAPLRMN